MTRTSFGFRAPALAIVAGVLGICLLPLACGGNGNPSVEEAARTYYRGYCTKYKECDDAHFTNKYGTDGGVEQCVETNSSGAGTIDSVCSQEQWDQCARDFLPDSGGAPADACAPIPGASPQQLLPVIPQSCHGC